MIAGVTAFIGFSSRMQPSVLNAAETLIFFVPLALLIGAFMVERGARAPNAESLRTFFPEYPVTTLRDTIAAISRASSQNARVNDMKAGRLDIAGALIACSAAIVLITQFVLALH